ncbi:MAG: hypothetical protein M3Z37_05940 [Candidatus Eremiobacteraeota bacterium]|nr:hypothetical protein [Candidatus Eremiobacteraeota bacterium]
MYLLHLLVAMAEDPDMRDEYYKAPLATMKKYKLSQEEQTALLAGDDAIRKYLARRAPGQVGTGEKKISVTFCGVMKGVGRGGGGGRAASSTRTPAPKDRGKKKAAKKKR